jgi:SAM-dependent methyltransferase
MSSSDAASTAGSEHRERQGDGPYDADYFQHYSPRTYERSEYWLTLFAKIADQITERIAPRRVLDAGCALGLLVEALRGCGIEADGIDVSTSAIAHAPESVRSHCRVASVTDELPDRYDLIVCIEVLEHLSPVDSAKAVANFCRHTDDVLFSSTPLHYRETTHVNVQPPEYWAERFAEHGFYRDLDFDASFITPWALRFRRGRDPFPRVIADYERSLARLAYERNELRSLSFEVKQEATAARARTPELEHVRAALEEVHGQLLQKLQELDELRARVHVLDADLGFAQATVQNMERSVFWRLRGVWVTIRRLLGARH